MLNDDSSGSLGGLTSMLGQFGLGMGSPESNIDRIMDLARARVITESSIFQKGEMKETNDYFANLLIDELKTRKAWSKKSKFSFGGSDELDLEDFRFSHDSISNFTLQENKALKKLYTHLVGKEKTGGAFQTDYSELSGIMNFHLTSTNPELCVNLVNTYFDELSAFYVDKANEKQTQDYNLVKSKYDSIQTKLNSVQYSIADFEDKNKGLYRRVDNLREIKLRGEEMKLVNMLAEAEKQLQITQLAMENSQAYIQLIDRPLLPLRPINKGRVYYFLLGGLLGGFFSIGYLIFKKVYTDLLQT